MSPGIHNHGGGVDSGGAAPTPGPWNCGRQRKIYAGTQTPVAQSIAVNGNYPEAQANAHLIASAPELYDALEAVVGAMRRYAMDVDDDPPFAHREMMRLADGALAKARGEA